MSFQFIQQIEPFLQHCRNQQSLSDNTILGYRQDLRAFARFLSDQQDPEFNNSCILNYLDDLRNHQNLAPATVRRRIVCLRKFFSWASKTHPDAPAPFEGLEIDLKIPRRLPRPIDRDILRELFISSPSSPTCSLDIASSRQATLFSSDFITALATRILIATGLRIGELTHLKLKDLSNGAKRIRVIGKGNRERTVYVTNQRLLQDLASYWQYRLQLDEPNAFLFLNYRGARLSEAAFRKRLRTLSQSLSLSETLTPHRFRHSAATLLIEEGVDIRIVQRLLGHASIATTEIYTRVSDNSLINAISQADTLAQIDPG